MKRKCTTVQLFTLRDPGGEHIHDMRVAAAKENKSMNEWLLRLIETATSDPTPPLAGYSGTLCRHPEAATKEGGEGK